MKKANIVGAIVIVSILVFGGLSALFGSVNPSDWHTAPVATTTPNGNGGNTNTLLNYGSFDVNTKGYNTLDFSQAYTEDSTYNVIWVAMRGGTPQRLGTDSQTIALIPQDYGIVWAIVKPISGQAYYVDAASTVSKNAPYCLGSQYSDIDNDGYNEWSFKIDLSQTPAPQGVGNNRVLWFYPYFENYELMDLNSPADITGIGTAAVNSFVNWEGSFADVNSAFAVSKIEIIANTTDLSQLTITKLNLPGVGSITGQMFGQPYRGADSLTWTYTISNSLNGADYLMYPSNTQNKVDLTTQVKTVLPSGDEVTLTLNIYGFDNTGTPTAVITGTVALAES